MVRAALLLGQTFWLHSQLWEALLLPLPYRALPMCRVTGAGL